MAVGCFEVARQRWLGSADADLPALLDEAFARLPGLLGSVAS
ncbi:hypothetical protein [Geodermatophilus sp. TF02-6]|nr:hypothetical protein [Geodermatophilus sp. TF02-6]